MRVTAPGPFRRRDRRQRRASLFKFGGVDQKINASLGDIEPDHVTVPHQRQRAAHGGFRGDVQHDGAERGAAHPRIRNPHHVLDAGTRKLHRDRQIARFRHPRRALGTGVAQHQHVVGGDVEIGAIDPQRHVLHGIEHHGAAGVLQQFRTRRRMLDHGAARREIAMQHRHRAFRLDRTFSRADDILSRHLLGGGNDIAQHRASDGLRIEVDQIAKLRHQLRHAPGVMEVLHVVRARWFQVDQHRHFAAESIKSFEVDAMFGAVGNRGQMNKAVGRSPDRLQHHLRILECCRCQQLARARSLRHGHRGGNLAAGFGGTKALGMRRRNRRAHRQRQAERFGDAGHGAGGAHHHAGADRRREPAIDGLDLDLVDFAGAEFRPQAAAIGAGP